MTGGRIYPDEVASDFPRPPETFEDGAGRTITVEVLGAEERSELVEMYDAFDPSDRAQGIPPTDRNRIEEWTETLVDDGLNVVAWHEGQVIGHATLVPDRDEESYELAIFVLQEYQGCGIGGRLIRLLLGHGAAAGVEQVWLTVERWNRPAIGLYEDVGFEPSGTDSFELEMSLRIE